MKPQLLELSGTLVEGRYELLGILGRGGMSEVYRAYDVETGEVVAFKRVRSECPKQKAAMQREAESLSMLSHPAIIKLKGSGTSERGPWLALEYIPGWDVGGVVESGRFDLVDFPRIAAQALQALAVVHEAGYVHGDIKPGNLLLEKTTGPWRAKLVDFGLCARPHEHDGSSSGPSKDDHGSIYFVAPERFSGQTVSVLADLYALGAVFYFLLSGKYPVDGANEIEVMAGHILGRVEPLEAISEIDPLIARWVMTLLAAEPGQRPASAMEALRGLAAAMAQRAIVAGGAVVA